MNRNLRIAINALGWCAAVFALLVCVALIGGLILYQRYSDRASKFDLTKIDGLPERSAVYDAHGELYSYFGGENRLIVPLSAVSKSFLDALIAREDSRFWEHQGVDWRGVLRASIANLRAGETKQGGSTITQQLARNACDLRARTLDRKALEAVLALRIEATYTKEQILELYVNRIYFGSGYHGIETAARGYFGKPASDLTLGESATLAALIRSPKRLSPNNQLDASWSERNVVLDRMQELHLISKDDAVAAKAQQLKVAGQPGARVTDDDIMDSVLQELETTLAPETIEFGGLAVFMTIDPQLQRLAQTVADHRLTEIEETKGFPHPKKRDFVPSQEGKEEKQTDYLQAALVAIDNRTGAIRAAVGGRDYSHSKYSRALQGKRQIGSTFKPFVYSAAFERGLLPGSLIDDSQITPGEFRDIPKNWSPDNSDGEYGGMRPAAFGLIKSRNTMSVRVGEFAGLSKVRDLAKAAGISENIPNYPVVFLGGFETTPRDLTGAYTIFPNQGIYRTPYLISSIEDRDGRVLWRAPEKEKRVLPADTAWMTSGLLQEVMRSGTAAKSASLGWKKPGGGKTGTTNDFHDAWFVGYTSSLTCGVWVGMDRPQTIFNKGYGATLALPVWIDFMQQIPEKEYPSAPFEPPEPSAKVVLCSVSGARATSACAAQGYSYQAELPVSRIPTETCKTHPEPRPQPAFTAVPTPAPAPASTRTPPTTVAATQPPSSTPTRTLTPTPAPSPTPPLAPAELTSLPRIGPGPSTLTPPPIPPPLYHRDEVNYERSTEKTASSQSGGRIIGWQTEPSSESDTPSRPSYQATVRSDDSQDSEVRTSKSQVRQVPHSLPPIASGPGESTSRTMEVRRAVPVTPSETQETDDSRRSVANPDGQRIVTERLPDGRMRTTITRTVREAPRDLPERPVKRRWRLFDGD